MQEYIELCRKRKTTAALAYMKKFISPWAETHLAQVQQAVVLLAFGEGTGVNTYRVSPGFPLFSSLEGTLPR